MEEQTTRVEGCGPRATPRQNWGGLQDVLKLCVQAGIAVADGHADSGALYWFGGPTRDPILLGWSGMPKSFAEAWGDWVLSSECAASISCGLPFHLWPGGVPQDAPSELVVEGLRAWGVFPLVADGNVKGFLNMASRRLGRFCGRACSQIEHFATMLAPVLHRMLEGPLEPDPDGELLHLFDAIAENLFILDPSGKMMWANTHAGAILGYASDDLEGMHVRDLHPVECREAAWAAIGQARAGASRSFSGSMLRADGERLPTRTMFFRGRWKNREIIFVISRREGERPANEARLEQLIQERTVHLSRRLEIERFVASNSRRFVNPPNVDAAIQESLAELGGKLMADRTYIFELDDHAGTMSNTREWCNAGIRPCIALLQDLGQAEFPWWMAELRARRPIVIPEVSRMPAEATRERETLEMQGVRSLIVVGIHGRSGLLGFLGMDNCLCIGPMREADVDLIAVFGDIIGAALQRRQAESALGLERARLRAMLEDTGDLVCSFGREGALLHANDAFCRFFGISPEELADTDIFRLFPAEERRILQGKLSSLCQTLPTAIRRHPSRRADGEVVWHRWTDRALLAADGTFQEYLSIGTAEQAGTVDMAGDKKREDRLFQARNMESVGRLAGGIAHEFNNMLQAILGYTYLSLKEIPRDTRPHADLVEARTAGLRLAELTRQIAAFAGQQVVSPRIVDLNALVEGMLSMVRETVGPELAIAWLPGEGVWPVKVDPGQVEQVLRHFCADARSATGIKRIAVATRNAEAVCTDHADAPCADCVVLSVTDDGCGMAPETLASLFEPFFPARGSRQMGGMELASAYGIAKQNGGFVEAASEPCRGTALRFYLPRHSAEDSRLDGPPESGTGRVRRGDAHHKGGQNQTGQL